MKIYTITKKQLSIFFIFSVVIWFVAFTTMLGDSPLALISGATFILMPFLFVFYTIGWLNHEDRATRAKVILNKIAFSIVKTTGGLMKGALIILMIFGVVASFIWLIITLGPLWIMVIVLIGIFFVLMGR